MVISFVESAKKLVRKELYKRHVAHVNNYVIPWHNIQLRNSLVNVQVIKNQGVRK